jgi:MATE family multidrug resistance protein
MVQRTINIIILGHMNNPALVAGVGLGNLFQTMIAFSILSVNGALDTLISQTYGSGDIKQCGIYLNRAKLVVLFLFLPITIFIFYSEKILISVGQDEIATKYAYQYNMATFLGLFLTSLQDCEKRYLNSMSRTKVPMYCNILG